MDKKPFSSGTDKNSFSSPRFLNGFETKSSVPITTVTLSSILTSIWTLMLVTTHMHMHMHMHMG